LEDVGAMQSESDANIEILIDMLFQTCLDDAIHQADHFPQAEHAMSDNTVKIPNTRLPTKQAVCMMLKQRWVRNS
jgi:hypothetical protein